MDSGSASCGKDHADLEALSACLRRGASRGGGPRSGHRRELEVAGRVLAHDGAGLARARVELSPLLPAHRLAELELAGTPLPEPVARVRTSGDGAFRLLAPRPGFWQLAVRHPESLPARFDLAPLLDAKRLPELRLPRRSELAARLTDEAGEPLVGVELLEIGWSEAWRTASEGGWWPAARRARCSTCVRESEARL